MPINEPKQTFIPKKSLAGAKRPSRRSSGVFFSISLIIFLISVAGAVGVYGYRVYLEKRVQNLSVSLERAKSAFEPSLIRELKQLNTRLDSADKVLSQHIALSEFFRILESVTLKSIRFTRFTYTLNENEMNIKLSGLAASYSSVALQSDIFGDSVYIKDSLFSNLGLDKSGNITFDFSANLDPSLVIYKETL